MSSIPNQPLRRRFTFTQALQGFMLDQNLPFASLLDEALVSSIFAKHRSLFGGVFHTAIVLWAFLSQVLHDGKAASCQSAVARISAFLAKCNRLIPNANTGDFCKARAKLSEHALRELSGLVAAQADEAANMSWRWKGLRAYLVDGFTFQMLDVREHQELTL